MNIPFYKCNSNGNDFIIILHFDHLDYSFFTKEKIRTICNYDNELYTDGFILLKIINGINIMNYYNNDGSWETFCLNGLICCSLLLNEEFKKNNFEIISNDVIYNTNISRKGYIQVELTKPVYKEKDILIHNYRADYLNSGARHLVVNYNDDWSNEKELIQKMKKMRYDELFKPEGININFYKVIDVDTIQVKTYEKGIESIMNSCASGSVACAYDYSKKYKFFEKINVINDGGESQIIFKKNYNRNFFTSKGLIEFKGELKI